MIADRRRELAKAALALPVAWMVLHLVDRIIAGFVQCEAAGTCPW